MAQSIQKAIGRVRAPRVHITYDVETHGAIEQRELPFIVGILADLGGEPVTPPPPVSERKFIEIDRDNFDRVMASLAPAIGLARLDNRVPASEAPELAGSACLEGLLKFRCLQDFTPLNIVNNVPALAAIYARRHRLRDLQTKLEIAPAVMRCCESLVAREPDEQAETLLGEFETAFPQGSMPEEWAAAEPGDEVCRCLLDDMLGADAAPERRRHCLQMLGQYHRDVVQWLHAMEDVERADNLRRQGVFTMLDARIAELDTVLADQLNVILHAPAFQRLEASWRGLHYLVSRAETGDLLKLRVLNISKRELQEDLDKALEFDQSHVFKLIYEAEYGTYGGNPFSALVGDYEFDRSADDFDLLNKVAQIAAAAHAPFIAAAYARLFDLNTFEHLANPRDLSKIFESLELEGWREFRRQEDSRYVTLALPRVLMRLPWGGDRGERVDGLAFEEDVDGRDQSRFLWGNPAWILAERITNAFACHGWPAMIRGVEGGGLIEGLPSYTFNTVEGDVTMVCPTQVAITDRREKELNDLGFMAICHCKGSSRAAFFGGQTTNHPRRYLTDSATANAQLSSMLPYILCASRFAHYIKVIMREKVGSFMTRANVESLLNDWIAQYVLLDDDAAQEVKAAYPLRAARVVVTDAPGKPGSYNATVYLKPHFQLDELNTSIRLVAELPA